MKIAVLMFYTDNIKSYADINKKINKLYCDKYKIELLYSNKINYKDRKSNWERFPFILENIQNYDYLIWIDSDAFFYIDSPNIIDIINENLNKDLIFSQDIGNKNINTGFFIIKNSSFSIDFLTKWAYDQEIYELCMNKKRWNDQEVLIYLYENNIMDIKNKSIVYNYGILQHFYENELTNFDKKPFIYHLAGRKIDERNNASTKYYENVMKIKET
jgi:hypothetical protein